MPPRLSCSIATADDAGEIAALRCRAAERLTSEFGHGHWSGLTSERGVLAGMRLSRILIARARGTVVGTLRLTLKKPWAIDRSSFTECRRPIYLVDMAVEPAVQRTGVGRRCLERAAHLAIELGGDSILLDAYDHAAGGGPFYAKCGYTERGRVVYRGVPLIYYEKVLTHASHADAASVAVRKRARRSGLSKS